MQLLLSRPLMCPRAASKGLLTHQHPAADPHSGVKPPPLDWEARGYIGEQGVRLDFPYGVITTRVGLSPFALSSSRR